MWKAFLTIESHKALRNEQLLFYPNYDDDIWLTHGLWLHRGGATNHSLLKHCSAGSCFEDCWTYSYNSMLVWQSTTCRCTTVLQHTYEWTYHITLTYLYVWNIQFSFELADASVREIQKNALVNITVRYYNIQPSANASMSWSLLYPFPPSLTLQ